MANAGAHDANVTYHMICFLHAVHDMYVGQQKPARTIKHQPSQSKTRVLRSLCALYRERIAGVFTAVVAEKFSPTLALL